MIDTSEAPHPKSPDEWVAVAERELSNIRGSYHGRLSNDRKIAASLAAIEAILKAILWKGKRWNSWPSRRGEFGYLYNHKIGKMLQEAGLHDQIMDDPVLAASWRTILNASYKKYTYAHQEPENKVTDSVARSVRHPDYGVYPWLLKIYKNLT